MVFDCVWYTKLQASFSKLESGNYIPKDIGRLQVFNKQMRVLSQKTRTVKEREIPAWFGEIRSPVVDWRPQKTRTKAVTGVGRLVEANF